MALHDFELVLTRIAQAQEITRVHVLRRNIKLLVGNEAQMPPVCSRSGTLIADVPLPPYRIASRQRAYLNDVTCSKFNLNHRNPGFAATLDCICDQHHFPLTKKWVDAHIYCLLDTTTALRLLGRIDSHRYKVPVANSAFLDAFNAAMICTPPSYKYKAVPFLAPFTQSHTARFFIFDLTKNHAN
jgi:hypothetical protein